MPHRWALKKSLQAYWRMTRALTLGAQGVVLDNEDRVLLVRHGYRPGWHFPGGGVEKNEQIMTALVRELKEETGVVPTSPPELFAMFANFASFPSDHIALFVVRNWERPQIPGPNREIVEQGFFAQDDLPPATVKAVPRRLAEIGGKADVDPNW